MDVQGSELVTMVRANVAAQFLQGLRDVLGYAYDESGRVCRNHLSLCPEIGENTRWGIRRGLIEQGMLDLAQSLALPGLEAKIICGKDQEDHPHNWNHIRICAGPVELTQCPLRSPEQSWRHSFAREAYVKNNRQGVLFEQRPKKAQITVLCALLIHGRAYWAKDGTHHALGFAQIRFPMPGEACGWYPERIDLLHEFPDSTGVYSTGPRPDVAPEETIANPPEPKIKVKSERA